MDREFRVEVLSETKYEDTTIDYSVMVTMINIRLSPEALNQYFRAECWNNRYCYETWEEWEEHKQMMEARMDAWKAKLAELIGLPEKLLKKLVIKQCLSEFFTVTYMENLKEHDEWE